MENVQIKENERIDDLQIKDATILPLQNKPGTTAKEGSPTHGMHSFCFCIFVILSFLFFVVSVLNHSPYLWRKPFCHER